MLRRQQSESITSMNPPNDEVDAGTPPVTPEEGGRVLGHSPLPPPPTDTQVSDENEVRKAVETASQVLSASGVVENETRAVSINYQNWAQYLAQFVIAIILVVIAVTLGRLGSTASSRMSQRLVATPRLNGSAGLTFSHIEKDGALVFLAFFKGHASIKAEERAVTAVTFEQTGEAITPAFAGKYIKSAGCLSTVYWTRVKVGVLAAEQPQQVGVLLEGKCYPNNSVNNSVVHLLQPIEEAVLGRGKCGIAFYRIAGGTTLKSWCEMLVPRDLFMWLERSEVSISSLTTLATAITPIMASVKTWNNRDALPAPTDPIKPTDVFVLSTPSLLILVQPRDAPSLANITVNGRDVSEVMNNAITIHTEPQSRGTQHQFKFVLVTLNVTDYAQVCTPGLGTTRCTLFYDMPNPCPSIESDVIKTLSISGVSSTWHSTDNYAVVELLEWALANKPVGPDDIVNEAQRALSV